MEFVLDARTHRVLKPLSNVFLLNKCTVKLKSLNVTVDLPKGACDGDTLFRTFYAPVLTRIRISVYSTNREAHTELLRGLLQAVTASKLPALQSLALLWHFGSNFDPISVEKVLPPISDFGQSKS